MAIDVSTDTEVALDCAALPCMLAQSNARQSSWNKFDRRIVLSTRLWRHPDKRGSGPTGARSVRPCSRSHQRSCRACASSTLPALQQAMQAETRSRHPLKLRLEACRPGQFACAGNRYALMRIEQACSSRQKAAELLVVQTLQRMATRDPHGCATNEGNNDGSFDPLQVPPSAAHPDNNTLERRCVLLLERRH